MRVLRPARAAQTSRFFQVSFLNVLKWVWAVGLFYFLFFRMILLASAIWLDPAVSERLRPFMRILVGIDYLLFLPGYVISYQVFTSIFPQPMMAELIGSAVMIGLAAGLLSGYAVVIYGVIRLIQKLWPFLSEFIQARLHPDES
jgi:hypothetical protein